MEKPEMRKTVNGTVYDARTMDNYIASELDPRIAFLEAEVRRLMEKPETVLLSTDLFDDDGGMLYYKASEMEPYIAELRASLREMVELSEWMQIYGFVILPEAGKQAIERARALIGEDRV